MSMTAGEILGKEALRMASEAAVDLTR